MGAKKTTDTTLWKKTKKHKQPDFYTAALDAACSIFDIVFLFPERLSTFIVFLWTKT